MELTLEQQELIELAKRVSPADVAKAKRALEALLDPFWQEMQAAPFDEEELTPEVLASLEEAKLEFARGEGIPHDEILREFGLERSVSFIGPREPRLTCAG